MRLPILAACLLLTVPAMAQDPKGEGELQQRRPLSDQVPGTPGGDQLTKPAQGPVPPDAPRQESVPAGESAATNARTLTEGTPVIEDEDVDVVRTTPDLDRPDGAAPPPGPPPRADASPTEAPEPAESFRGERPIGPNAGSATGVGRVYAEDLKDYTVHLSDREKFGTVARVIVDLESGRLQALEVSTGGLLGVGDQRYDIPWDAVAAVNTGTRELRVAVSESQVQGQREAFDRPTPIERQ